jgi:hypothetical protein
MALSAWEVLDLAGSPRNPWGELRLVWRLLAKDRLLLVPIAFPVSRPVLARAA